MKQKRAAVIACVLLLEIIRIQVNRKLRYPVVGRLEAGVTLDSPDRDKKGILGRLSYKTANTSPISETPINSIFDFFELSFCNISALRCGKMQRLKPSFSASRMRCSAR